MKELEEKKVLVSEVVANIESDFQEAKLKYDNLQFGNLRPYCTDVKTVSDIEYYYLGTYKGITNPIELHQEFLSLLHLYLGEDLDKKYFFSDYYSDNKVEDKYNSFAEYEQALLQGEDLEVSSLAYLKQNKEDIKYAELQLPLGNVLFNKGNIYNSIPMEKKQNTSATQARFLCEEVARYYVNNLDNNLDDKYPLKNGELSIREGITFVEDYINDKLGVEGNKDVKLKVTMVSVYKICEEYYCYYYQVTREILGLTKRCVTNGSLQNIRIKVDTSDAYMIYTDDIDQYWGRSTILDYKKLNEVDKILPLSEALRIVSEGVGENSFYEVKNISLGYMDIQEAGEVKVGNIDGRMEPSWIIECRNTQDYSETVFYVNVNTGVVTVV